MMKLFGKRSMLVMLCLSVVFMGGLDRRTLDALKVRHILRKIETNASRTTDPQRREQVTEAEVNAYIAKHLDREQPPGIRDLRVTLMDRDHLKGALKIDAEQLNLGRWFGREWDVKFKGVLHTRRGRGRIDFSALWINGRSVAPKLLDMVISAVDAVNGTSTGSIEDWVALPKGVKRIRLTRGRALLHY